MAVKLAVGRPLPDWPDQIIVTIFRPEYQHAPMNVLGTIARVFRTMEMGDRNPAPATVAASY